MLKPDEARKFFLTAAQKQLQDDPTQLVEGNRLWFPEAAMWVNIDFVSAPDPTRSALHAGMLAAGVSEHDVLEIFDYVLSSYSQRLRKMPAEQQQTMPKPSGAGSFIVVLSDYLHAVASWSVHQANPCCANRPIGPAGGQLTTEFANINVPCGATDEVTTFSVTDATTTQSTSLSSLGAKPCSAVLELQPHGVEFSTPVMLHIAVPEGDEEKPMVLLHRDTDEDQWRPLETKCTALGPGQVQVAVEAFCFVVLSFPFSGMENLFRKEFADTAPPWRTIGQGTNLMARCTNKECEAVDEAVVVRLGKCCFDFEKDADLIACPRCYQPCTRSPDDTVLFVKCGWKFDGTLCDGERRSAEGRVPGGGYYEMEPRSEKGTVDVMWKSLTITTTD